MKNLAYKIFMFFACALGFLSCTIENDIPYPFVELKILSIEGNGFIVNENDIDEQKRTVTLTLDETTDISKVEITKVQMTDLAESSVDLVGTFDMRTPLEFVLSLYADYPWTIQANQNIERSFEVKSQIGSTVFDLNQYTATVYVSDTMDLSKVEITELKLGPEGITTLTPSNLIGVQNFSLSNYKQVYAQYHDFSELWKLYVIPTDVVITFDKCSLFSCVAWLEASANLDSGVYGFEYRKVGDDSWSKVDASNITASGGTFSSKLTIEPETNYQFRAYSNSDVTEVLTKTSGSIVPLTNGDMESWHKPGKFYVPYGEGESEFWSTGNEGSTTLSASDVLTTPCYTDLHDSTSGTTSAQLESKKVSIKFAAGNLFVGTFLGTSGTDGIIAFGRPFTERPQSLKLYVKYNCGQINNTSDDLPNITTSNYDTGSIYIALGTWTADVYGKNKDGEVVGSTECPVVIDTRSSATFFNPTSEAVVAYGAKEFTSSVDWSEVEIPLDYYSYDVMPTHIIIVCSASKYGDYFVGSTSSKMWVDDMELVY